MNPTLTQDEKVAIARNCKNGIQFWLMECQRLSEQFAVASNMTDLITSATYFLMAAGCAYLHCQTLIEVAKRQAAGDAWMYDLSNDPALKSLKTRRNMVNHGGIRKMPGYLLGKHYSVVLTDTISFGDSLSIVKEGGVSHQTLTDPPTPVQQSPPIVRFSWLDKDSQGEADMTEWHREVIASLQKVTEDAMKDQVVANLLALT